MIQDAGRSWVQSARSTTIAGSATAVIISSSPDRNAPALATPSRSSAVRRLTGRVYEARPGPLASAAAYAAGSPPHRLAATWSSSRRVSSAARLQPSNPHALDGEAALAAHAAGVA